ncbi:MAG: polysaccharide deacetylase family protein [Candidatus Glassbacteria bacterium]
MAQSVIRILTIDLEDWFHGLEPEPTRWCSLERRLNESCNRLLDLLDEYAARATFFVLGDVARNHPRLISQISQRGHETGSHGMEHRFVAKQGPENFREDLHSSIELIQDLTGKPVNCYRAPYFSISKDSLWALDIIADEGIRIDSSIFPVRNPRYGWPGFSRVPVEVLPGLWEWPVSTLATPLGNFPFAGGVYFRFLPWKIVERAVLSLDVHGEPLIFYIHPWEIDNSQPKYCSDSSFLDFRHYYGIGKTEGKLKRLLALGSFQPLEASAASWQAEISANGL